jgi:hypothetical protein
LDRSDHDRHPEVNDRFFCDACRPTTERDRHSSLRDGYPGRGSSEFIANMAPVAIDGVWCIYIYMYIYIYRYIRLAFSGLRTKTGANRHAFPFFLHPISLKSDGSELISASLFVFLICLKGVSIHTCQAQARCRPAAKSANSRLLLVVACCCVDCSFGSPPSVGKHTKTQKHTSLTIERLTNSHLKTHI